MTDKEETGGCIKCGSPKGRPKTIWGDEYYVCKYCEDEAKGIARGVVRMYLCGDDCFIGFRAKDIPELKGLFAQSENEDIRELVEFLEGVEADIGSREAKE